MTELQLMQAQMVAMCVVDRRAGGWGCGVVVMLAPHDLSSELSSHTYIIRVEF